jgi:hypothetical protein
MTAVPPSQFQPACDGCAGRAGTDPVMSRLTLACGGGGNGAWTGAGAWIGAGTGAIAALYDPMPCPPPETPADAMVAGRLVFGGGGSGCAEM